jgi:hypothetical protein
MRVPSLHFSPDTRRRAISIVLTIIIHLLLLLLLLQLAPLIEPKSAPSGPLSTFNVSNDGENSSKSKVASRSAQKSGGKAAPATAARPAEPPKIVHYDNPNAITLPPEIMTLSKDQYAASDIGKIKGNATGASGDSASKGNDNGEGAVASAGGGGSGGDQLYEADWYRRPTDAELSFYLPKNRRPIGWGMIACQTVPGNRVENCREIGQSPPGSGLSRAVREAAWQFRVLPPRVGSKPMIGAWVRIRIEYTENSARVTD